MEETKEIWKYITGYEGLYKVSNLGRVKSLERKEKIKNGYRTIKEKILKPGKCSNGYFKVQLYNEGMKKYITIHRLVAQAFVQNNSLFYNEINHKDEDKTNNNASNLEWCDAKYNCNFGTRNERMVKKQKGVYNTKTSKAAMCIETGKIYPSAAEVKRQFGFDNSSITKCCRGKHNTCGGYHWRYVD